MKSNTLHLGGLLIAFGNKLILESTKRKNS